MRALPDDQLALLRALDRGGVELVVVGGGAPPPPPRDRVPAIAAPGRRR
jgi:hypothetical protein